MNVGCVSLRICKRWQFGCADFTYFSNERTVSHSSYSSPSSVPPFQDAAGSDGDAATRDTSKRLSGDTVS